MKHRLDPLLRPKSIAVVGATQRRHAVGNYTIENLTRGQYPGTLYAVNPHYDDVLGVPCYPSLADLPDVVEHIVFAISDAGIEEALDDAIEHGARAVTITSSLVLSDDNDPPLKDRIREMVTDAGLLVCGANCMGFYNVTDRVLAGTFDTRRLEPPGNIAYISHSGAGMSGIVDCDERLRFNLVVTTGQELTLTLEDYLDFVLDLPETKVVGLFMETSRQPAALICGFEKANERKIPIVAIKVGKTALSKELTYSHSGAMAGSDKAFDAVFDRYGVQRVTDMDQLATALIMFAQPHPVGPGGLASIHDSGGERQLTIDLAERIDLPLAKLNDATIDMLEQILDPGLQAINPLDAWGAGGDHSDENMCECFAAMMADADTSFGAVIHDRAPYSKIYPEYCAYLRAGHAASGKPVFLVAARQGTGSDPLVVESTRNGLPILDGLQPFLRGAKSLMEYRDFLKRRNDNTLASPDSAVPTIEANALDPWLGKLRSGQVLHEAEASALLRDTVMQTAESELIDDIDQALDAAHRIGYPVVLKTANPAITHKAEHCAVHLNLNSDTEVKAAYDALSAQLGPAALVARYVSPGPELILGMYNDVQFGPLVMIGAGGTTAETDVDAVWELAPFGNDSARRMIDRLRMRPVLNGVRSARPIDIEALCTAAARLSVLSDMSKGSIDSIDINPVIASDSGCVAVDALIIPRKR